MRKIKKKGMVCEWRGLLSDPKKREAQKCLNE